MGSFCPKYIMFQLEYLIGVIFNRSLIGVMTLKSDAKFNGKVTLGLINDIKNLVNFYASSCKFENLHIDGLDLSKAYKILDEKVQKSYV